MCTRPNRARLRQIALVFLGLGVSFFAVGILLATPSPVSHALMVTAEMIALPLLAIGLAFWTLSRDRRAGVIVDSKGLLLNLGHSSAFIAWSNIERAGVTGRCTSVLALGSRRQLGIALRDVQPYIQSYETRLPAAPGPLEWGLRLVEYGLRTRRRRSQDIELALYLASCRRRTGYDVLIPEVLLGQQAASFASQLEERLQQPVGLHPRPAAA